MRTLKTRCNSVMAVLTETFMITPGAEGCVLGVLISKGDQLNVLFTDPWGENAL